MAHRFRQLGTRQRATVVGGGTLGTIVVVVIVILVLLPGGGGHNTAGGSPTTTTTGTTPQGTPKPPPKGTVSHLCPLTGKLAPGGKVPDRPALAAKVGNDPDSRPQTGLLDADIVYEEMAEGGVTRYMAVFQCTEPRAIGPMRSVRWDDWHLLRSYGNPILSFSGGIQQWDNTVASISTNDRGTHPWLFDGNGSEGATQSAFSRTTTGQPPYNYFLSASEMWRMDPNHTPPPPQFVYSLRAPKGSTSAAYANIEGFASGATVSWSWDRRAQQWLRYVGGQPDVDSSGPQYHATNVIIELMRTQPGPYSESCDFEDGANVCDNDVESISVGSGTAYILRNGAVEKGTWSRPTWTDVTAYHLSNGEVMTLEPGNTWIEVVPETGYPVSIRR